MVCTVASSSGCISPEIEAARRKFPEGTPVRVKGYNVTGVIVNYRDQNPVQYYVEYIPTPRGGILGSSSTDTVCVPEVALERIK